MIDLRYLEAGHEEGEEPPRIALLFTVQSR